MPSVWVGLGSSAITEARHGNFDTAQALFDEAIALSVAVGAHNQVAWSWISPHDAGPATGRLPREGTAGLPVNRGLR